MAKLRAAVITDIHYGFDTKDKLGSKAPKLMKQFVKAVNKYAPDCVIDLGDRVSARDEQSDRKFMKELKKHFNKVAAPVYSVIGNHDLKHVGREGNEKIMGNPSDSYSEEIGGVHLVFWNPKVIIDDDGIDISEEDFQWLRENLASTDKKAVLFSHVPLDNLNGEETDRHTRYFFWTQGEKIREILEEAGNVVLCMHGHRHRNRHREINGIHYVTQQSFTNQWKEKYRVPARAYSYLEIDDDKITIKLQGKFQKTYDLDPRPIAA